MAYLGALVDRARRVERRVGHRDPVLGESEFIEQPGEWYKARLVTPESSESRSEESAARENIQAELLMTKDMTLNIDDRVEVDSKELGRDIWIVVGQPKALRKKRTVLGQSVGLRKVKTL
jgi:hypothetical protein